MFQKNFSTNYLKKFANNLKLFEKTVVKDFVLYKEGDIADRIFIVKKGEFIVSRKK